MSSLARFVVATTVWPFEPVAEKVGIGFEIPSIVLFVLKPSEREDAVAT